MVVFSQSSKTLLLSVYYTYYVCSNSTNISTFSNTEATSPSQNLFCVSALSLRAAAPAPSGSDSTIPVNGSGGARAFRWWRVPPSPLETQAETSTTPEGERNEQVLDELPSDDDYRSYPNWVTDSPSKLVRHEDIQPFTQIEHKYMFVNQEDREMSSIQYFFRNEFVEFAENCRQVSSVIDSHAHIQREEYNTEVEERMGSVIESMVKDLIIEGLPSYERILPFHARRTKHARTMFSSQYNTLANKDVTFVFDSHVGSRCNSISCNSNKMLLKSRFLVAPLKDLVLPAALKAFPENHQIILNLRYEIVRRETAAIYADVGSIMDRFGRFRNIEFADCVKGYNELIKLAQSHPIITGHGDQSRINSSPARTNDLVTVFRRELSLLYSFSRGEEHLTRMHADRQLELVSNAVFAEIIYIHGENSLESAMFSEERCLAYWRQSLHNDKLGNLKKAASMCSRALQKYEKTPDKYLLSGRNVKLLYAYEGKVGSKIRKDDFMAVRLSILSSLAMVYDDLSMVEDLEMQEKLAYAAKSAEKMELALKAEFLPREKKDRLLGPLYIGDLVFRGHEYLMDRYSRFGEISFGEGQYDSALNYFRKALEHQTVFKDILDFWSRSSNRVYNPLNIISQISLSHFRIGQLEGGNNNSFENALDTLNDERMYIEELAHRPEAMSVIDHVILAVALRVLPTAEIGFKENNRQIVDVAILDIDSQLVTMANVLSDRRVVLPNMPRDYFGKVLRHAQKLKARITSDPRYDALYSTGTSNPLEHHQSTAQSTSIPATTSVESGCESAASLYEDARSCEGEDSDSSSESSSAESSSCSSSVHSGSERPGSEDSESEFSGFSSSESECAGSEGSESEYSGRGDLLTTESECSESEFSGCDSEEFREELGRFREEFGHEMDVDADIRRNSQRNLGSE